LPAERKGRRGGGHSSNPHKKAIKITFRLVGKVIGGSSDFTDGVGVRVRQNAKDRL